MSMVDWAEKEVALAIEREAPNRKDDEWDYGVACYESALKAYKSIMGDEHSGLSFAITANILKRLLNNQPLTPIEDVPEVWNFITDKNGEQTYQCNRRYSLFKTVHKDGTVEYRDNNRVICKDNNGSSYYCKLVSDIIYEIFPITLPLTTLETYAVDCEEFLTDPANGDFDTIGVIRCKTPNGQYHQIGRYFKSANTESGWEEISHEEFKVRKLVDKYRRLKNKKVVRVKASVKSNSNNRE